jgi:hypothetical protein
MGLGKEIKPHVTAVWARKKSEAVLSDKVSTQLSRCLESVENAINNDDEYTNVTGYPHEKVLNILRQRGFKVEKHDAYDQRDSDYITISW